MSAERHGGPDRREGSPETGSGTGFGSSVDWGSVGEYAVVGFAFPLALIVGFFAGRWAGEWLGGPTVGMVAGVVLGAAAAFWNLYSSLRRLERREAGRSSPEPEERRGERQE